MSWQKCPVCNGSGKKAANYTSSSVLPCDVCDGKKIINEITGLPPTNITGEQLHNYARFKKWLKELK